MLQAKAQDINRIARKLSRSNFSVANRHRHRGVRIRASQASIVTYMFMARIAAGQSNRRLIFGGLECNMTNS